MSRKLTTSEFIERAKAVHGDKDIFDKVEYIDARTKVCMICPIHGEYWITPDNYLHGRRCFKCGRDITAKKRTLTNEEFKKRANKIHNNKYIYDESVYTSMDSKVKIICPIHGVFEQIAHDHLDGHGCPKCGMDSMKEKQKCDFDDIIKRFRKIHGNKYDYSKSNYINYRSKILIICPKHGEFWQTPSEHLNGCGCPYCNESKLESKTSCILNDNFIKNDRQKRFTWLGRQSLDFYLPKYKIGIECQGEQHFKAIKHFGGKDELEHRIQLDYRKKSLCEEHGVKLYYINYNDDVETKLQEILEKNGISKES